MSRPSTPRPCGRSPIRACCSGVDAVGDEVVQQPVRTDHAERAVPGADQLAGRLHDALQGGAQIQVGADADHRVEQRPQPLPAGHHLADPVQHLLQQLVEADPRQRAQPQRRGRWRFPRGLRRAAGHRAMVAPVTFLAETRQTGSPRTAEVSTTCAVASRGVCGGPACVGSAMPNRSTRYGKPSPESICRKRLPGAGHLHHRRCSGTTDTPSRVAVSQPAESASPARSQLSGSSSSP